MRGVSGCCLHQGGMRSHVEWAKESEKGEEMAREEGKGEEEEQQN